MRGYVLFRMPPLFHPAACLLAWLITVAALQFQGPIPLLAGLGLLGFLGGVKVLWRWLHLLRRARWLLLTLALVLAYGTPGEAWLDQAWAPTGAGLYEAALHLLRLVAMLGALAWLFEKLSRADLMAGLWALLSPLAAWGIAADRMVVRLALVLDYVDRAPPKGSWRHLLDEAPGEVAGPDRVSLADPAWRAADAALVAVVAIGMGVGAWLG